VGALGAARACPSESRPLTAAPRFSKLVAIAMCSILRAGEQQLNQGESRALTLVNGPHEWSASIFIWLVDAKLGGIQQRCYLFQIARTDVMPDVFSVVLLSLLREQLHAHTQQEGLDKTHSDSKRMGWLKTTKPDLLAALFVVSLGADYTKRTTGAP